jgi:tetratricopeptide (TPR) repeat protein
MNNLYPTTSVVAVLFGNIPMKRFTCLCVVGLQLSASSCFAATNENQEARIDEVPMYGGIDRSAVAELKAGDEKFITDVTAQFGSREQASRKWVNQGYRFYNHDQLGMAMRRFNQAWLLNPQNPEVYAGFGSVLHDQGHDCDSAKMMEKALTLNPPTFQGIYPDAAQMVALCALNDKTLSAKEKTGLLARSEALYKKALQIEPDKRYIYNAWAHTYFKRAQYGDAWRMVAKAREQGTGSGAIVGMPSAAADQPSDKFLNQLREKMPEPTLK